MRRLVAVVAVLALAACTDKQPTNTQDGRETLTSLESAAPVVFNTQLLAENEPNSASSSESKGHAQVKVQSDGTIEFTLSLNNKDDQTFTRAHIHKAPAGANGPIHWDFHEPPQDAPFTDAHPPLRGTARPRAAANPNVSDLLANPHLYYVNVHSVLFPGGVVRGQLP